MKNIKNYQAKVEYFDYYDNLIDWKYLSFSISEGFEEEELKTLVSNRLNPSLSSHLDCHSFSVSLKEIGEEDEEK